MKLSVPYFKQQYPYTCVVACVRMLLAYMGKEYTKDELVGTFGTVPVWGTRPEAAIAGLENLGYHGLWFENASLERLLDLLDHGWPVIAFLRAADLPHGHAGLHAIVVVGFESGDVICLDPTIEEELHLEISLFLDAWSGLGNQGMVVWV